jgi:hypothetical protein
MATAKANQRRVEEARRAEAKRRQAETDATRWRAGNTLNPVELIA